MYRVWFKYLKLLFFGHMLDKAELVSLIWMVSFFCGINILAFYFPNGNDIEKLWEKGKGNIGCQEMLGT